MLDRCADCLKCLLRLRLFFPFSLSTHVYWLYSHKLWCACSVSCFMCHTVQKKINKYVIGCSMADAHCTWPESNSLALVKQKLPREHFLAVQSISEYFCYFCSFFCLHFVHVHNVFMIWRRWTRMKIKEQRMISERNALPNRKRINKPQQQPNINFRLVWFGLVLWWLCFTCPHKK